MHRQLYQLNLSRLWLLTTYLNFAVTKVNLEHEWMNTFWQNFVSMPLAQMEYVWKGSPIVMSIRLLSLIIATVVAHHTWLEPHKLPRAVLLWRNSTQNSTVFSAICAGIHWSPVDCPHRGPVPEYTVGVLAIWDTLTPMRRWLCCCTSSWNVTHIYSESFALPRDIDLIR